MDDTISDVGEEVDGSLNVETDNQSTIQTVQNGTKDSFTLTQARHVISPYLPPPVLHVMKTIDSNPNTKMIGDEPSMTILISILAVLVIGKSIQFLSFLTSGKAVEGLDDDDAPEGNVLSDLNKLKGSKGMKHDKMVSYNDSVILFGPSHAGKTCLFHTLLSKKRADKEQDERREIPRTVMSLKANASIMQKNEKSESENDSHSGKDCIRLVDYPGHVTLSTHLPSLLYPASKSGTSVRGLLVVDSTKSVSDAAILLYNTVLTNSALLNAWETQNEIFQIMVVCNKTDVTNAKNWRRIKIQLRSELEKLKKISSSVSSGDATLLDGNVAKNEEKRHLTGRSINLDDLSKNGLSHIKISFLSCSCSDGTGLEALEAFVTNGDLLLDNSSVLSSRRA